MTAGWSAVLAVAACLLVLVGAGWRARTRLDRRLREADRAVVTARPGMDERTAGFGVYLRPFRGALVITVLLALVDAGLGLAGAWPLKIVIDNALGGQPLSAGLPLVGGLSGSDVVGVAVLLAVGLVAASALLGYLVVMLVSTLSLGIAADLRTAVFDQLLILPVLVHDRHRSGDLVTRLTTDISQVQQALVARVQVAIPNLAKLAGMTALMLLIDAPLALTVLAAIPPLAALAIVRQRRVATTQRVSRAQFGDLAARAAEVLRHVRAVQVFGQQTVESAEFRRSCATSATASSAAMRTSARLAPLTNLILAVVLGAVLWIGTGQVQTGALTLGGLTVFLAYLASVRGPVAALSGLAATLGRGTASAERLTELLDERPLPQP
ncbi:MAG: ABC transporter transmembrane domain-containing protein, partial [Microbacteriaceae bacterium]